VRLEERVNSHDQTLSRYGNRLDTHDVRIREAELWQATYGDKSSVERMITNVQGEVNELKVEKKVEKDIGKEVLKWLVGILAMIVIYKFTKGS